VFWHCLRKSAQHAIKLFSRLENILSSFGNILSRFENILSSLENSYVARLNGFCGVA
jgi:hypothetical protein